MSDSTSYFTSPACGGGRRAKRGGWGKAYPLEPRVVRKRPHPNPPPQAGEGACLRCLYGSSYIGVTTSFSA
jgi:hypothetical protein